MALLTVNLDREIGNAQLWREMFAAQLPTIEIRIFPDTGDPRDVEYLAFMHPAFGLIPELPNLKAMFSRSAGVDNFINHPRLPKVPLGKIDPSGGDPMMTEYIVMHVLRLHREVHRYQKAQASKQWYRAPIVRPEGRRIGFLG
jgi:glyoxylate/hydroxypyruvate reductase A